MAQSNTPAPNNQVAKLKKFQEETVNKVLDQVKQFEQMDALHLPQDYSPANALKAAWFTLIKTQTRDKRPVLEACDNPSIVNSLMEMVTQGLNPAKKQCAFIAYGSQLTMQPEYFGSIALAKRYNPEVLDIVGEVIHKDDKFKYKIENGRKYLVEHDQPFENLDKDIIGAYATVILREGEPYIVPMTMKEIRAAWGQGATKGNSPAHQNFSGEMAKKSAINRACKPYINSSDDSEIVKNRNSQDYVSEQANSKKIDFVEDGEAEEVKDEPEQPKQKAQPTSEPNEYEKMPFKNMNEAKSFLIDNGVHPAALKSEQDIHDAAAAKEIEIVIDGPDF